MKRTFNKASSHKAAEEWDVAQQVKMTPEERQEISRELKRRFYGAASVDVRKSGVFGKRTIRKRVQV